MSILVTTCITLSSGDSTERFLKVGISDGEITLGNIGRHFWPHIFAVMTCSSAQIYDEELDSYVDALHPDELAIGPKSKVRFKFVQSKALSVISPPASYTLRDTAEGSTMIIGHSTNLKNSGLNENGETAKTKVSGQFTRSTNIETQPKAPTIAHSNAHQMDEPCYITFGNSAITYSELQQTLVSSPDNSQIASKPRKQRRLISPTETEPSDTIYRSQKDRATDSITLPSENSSIQSCLDVKQEISDDDEPQTEKPESRKRHHRSISPRETSPKKRETNESGKKLFSSDSSVSGEIPPLSGNRDYPTLRFSSPLFEIKQFAAKVDLDSYALLRRLFRCNAQPDSDLIDILSPVIAHWLNNNAPGHSLNLRRAVVQNFLSELFSRETCDIQVFTNMDCSGTVDKLIVQNSAFLEHEVLRRLDNRWKSERPAKKMDITHHFKSIHYREGLMNRIKLGELDIDELFIQYPYFLRERNFLEDEFQRICETSASVEDFVHKWKTTYSHQITKVFAKKKFILPQELFPDEMHDTKAYTEFIKLFALSKNHFLPVTVVKNFVFFIKGSDEKIKHEIRTERAIAHPIILADKHGYQLFVGKQSIFRRTKHFLHALAQYIIVTNILHIPPVKRFACICHALNKMYGLPPLFNSSHGDVLYWALRDGVVPNYNNNLRRFDDHRRD